MSDLITIPAEDNFETTLTQSRNGGVGDVLVNDIPTSTIASGEKSYIVVNPGQSNMQVARVSSWSSSPSKKFVVDSIAVNEGNATPYTQKAHSANSVVRFSNNYQFWKDIQTAVNSKIDSTELGNFTFNGSKVTATGDMSFKDDNNVELTLSDLASGGGADQKVAITTNDTTTGTLDTKLTAGDGLKKTVVNPGASETMDLDIDTADTTTFVKTSSGSGDENKIPVLNASGVLPEGFRPASASDSDVTTGTSTIKTVNTSQVYKSLLFTPSNNLLVSLDTERTTTSTTYVKVKEIIVNRSGTIRFKFDIKSPDSFTVYGRIYKNSNAFGTEQGSSLNNIYETKSEDLFVSIGDSISLYIKEGTTGHICSIKNFRLYYNLSLGDNIISITD